MKKTVWYPRDVQPVRTGWYECYGSWYENKPIVMRFFDCKKNKWFWQSDRYGFNEAVFSSDDKWRGLAQKP